MIFLSFSFDSPRFIAFLVGLDEFIFRFVLSAEVARDPCQEKSISRAEPNPSSSTTTTTTTSLSRRLPRSFYKTIAQEKHYTPLSLPSLPLLQFLLLASHSFHPPLCLRTIYRPCLPISCAAPNLPIFPTNHLGNYNNSSNLERATSRQRTQEAGRCLTVSTNDSHLKPLDGDLR